MAAKNPWNLVLTTTKAAKGPDLSVFEGKLAAADTDVEVHQYSELFDHSRTRQLVEQKLREHLSKISGFTPDMVEQVILKIGWRIAQHGAEGIAPKMQKNWTVRVTHKAIPGKFLTVELHSVLGLKMGTGEEDEDMKPDELTVMRVLKCFVGLQIGSNLNKPKSTDMKLIVNPMDFDASFPNSILAACLIGVDAYSRHGTNFTFRGVDITAEELAVATFVVGITSGMMIPIETIGRLIKSNMLSAGVINKYFPTDAKFPPVRTSDNMLVLVNNLVNSAANKQLKQRFIEAVAVMNHEELKNSPYVPFGDVLNYKV